MSGKYREFIFLGKTGTFSCGSDEDSYIQKPKIWPLSILPEDTQMKEEFVYAELVIHVHVL